MTLARSLIRAACALLLVPIAAAPAVAAPPEPIDPTLFPFPGAVIGPGTAASAGMALADRWLGDEPLSNPAVRLGREVVLSPALLHMSRQDLRSDNRNFDETPVFLDAASGWIAMPVGGGLTAFGYAWQEVARLEDNAFQRGINQPQPATMSTTSSARELRAGGGASFTRGALTVGAAGEWTVRSDSYETNEQSGSPLSGFRSVDFEGSGVGGQAGVRWDHRATEPWGFTVGAGVRWVPALTLEGEQRFELIAFDSTGTVSAEREANMEAGLSARVTVTPAFRVLAAFGGRTAREWTGFDVTEGMGAEWRLGLDFHDARDPWTLRFGVGQEQQEGVPEPRAGVIAIGMGWTMESTVLDFGVIRRALSRADQPTSFDDRLLATVSVRF